MFTKNEKKFLLDLLNNVQVSGTRITIPKTLEEIDALARKIEAMPVEQPVPVPTETPPTPKAAAGKRRH